MPFDTDDELLLVADWSRDGTEYVFSDNPIKVRFQNVCLENEITVSAGTNWQDPYEFDLASDQSATVNFNAASYTLKYEKCPVQCTLFRLNSRNTLQSAADGLVYYDVDTEGVDIFGQ